MLMRSDMKEFTCQNTSKTSLSIYNLYMHDEENNFCNIVSNKLSFFDFTNSHWASLNISNIEQSRGFSCCYTCIGNSSVKGKSKQFIRKHHNHKTKFTFISNT